MLLRQLLLQSLVLPALIAGAIGCCDPALFRRSAGRAPRSGAAALAAAWLAGFVAIGALPAFPPGEVLGWLFWLVAAAGVAGSSWHAFGRRLRVAVAAAAAVATVASMLRPLVTHTWEPSAAAGWLLAATTTTLASLWGFDALAGADERRASESDRGRRTGGAVAAASLLLTASAAATLGLSATVRLAQLMGILTVALAAVAIVGLVMPARRALLGRGAALPLGLAYSGLLMNGHFYAELRWTGWVALALAPAAAGLAHRAAGGAPRRALAAVVAAALVLGAAALAPAIWQRATAEPGMYDYY